jgi:guanosine-3',5'-bis(diphosphate) 3'-pyrophosphohydrolase
MNHVDKSCYYLEPCTYTIRLIERLKSLDTKNTLDFNIINKAIHWARKYHGTQMRKSGEPYYTHPLEVAYIISEHTIPTTNLIVVSILHDIIEDTEVTAGMILDNFGWRIAKMVDALTRDRPDGTKLSVAEIINNAIEKGDKEVLLIKVMDRVHNLQNIKYLKKEKQISTAKESLDDILLATTYLKDINIESMLGSIINEILNYSPKNKLLEKIVKNKLLDNFSDSD